MNIAQVLCFLNLHRVKRFQTHENPEGIDVSNHTLRVHILYKYLGGSEDLASLTHDLEESVTGDIPSPIKKHINGLDFFKQLVVQFKSEEEKLLHKMCDKLCIVLQLNNYRNNPTLSRIYDNEYADVVHRAKELKKFEQIQELIERATGGKWLEYVLKTLESKGD